MGNAVVIMVIANGSTNWRLRMRPMVFRDTPLHNDDNVAFIIKIHFLWVLYGKSVSWIKSQVLRKKDVVIPKQLHVL